MAKIPAPEQGFAMYVKWQSRSEKEGPLKIPAPEQSFARYIDGTITAEEMARDVSLAVFETLYYLDTDAIRERALEGGGNQEERTQRAAELIRETVKEQSKE